MSVLLSHTHTIYTSIGQGFSTCGTWQTIILPNPHAYLPKHGLYGYETIIFLWKVQCLKKVENSWYRESRVIVKKFNFEMLVEVFVLGSPKLKNVYFTKCLSVCKQHWRENYWTDFHNICNKHLLQPCVPKVLTLPTPYFFYQWKL